ncbi:MAG: hypothetical protein U0457_13860 [Candidatus Sericytochromatia bacterium]
MKYKLIDSFDLDNKFDNICKLDSKINIIEDNIIIFYSNWIIFLEINQNRIGNFYKQIYDNDGPFSDFIINNNEFIYIYNSNELNTYSIDFFKKKNSENFLEEKKIILGSHIHPKYVNFIPNKNKIIVINYENIIIYDKNSIIELIKLNISNIHIRKYYLDKLIKLTYDGNKIIIWHEYIDIFNLNTGNLEIKLPYENRTSEKIFDVSNKNILVFPNLKNNLKDLEIIFYNLDKKDIIKKIEYKSLKNSERFKIRNITISNNGKYIAFLINNIELGNLKYFIDIYNMETFELLLRIEDQEIVNLTNSLAFSKNSDFLIIHTILPFKIKLLKLSQEDIN